MVSQIKQLIMRSSFNFLLELEMAIDILHCYETPPKPREYVLPGLLPGTVGSIVAPGGTGKSMLALEFAHYVASGADLTGLGVQQHTGRVTYLSCEDGADILHERLHAMGRHLSSVQREACAEQLMIDDYTGHAPDLFEQEWREAVERLATGTRLLFLDTLRSFHGGDENSNSEMSVLISYIRAIAARTGCAIVFLHHTSKAATLNGQGDSQQAPRGASALTDNVRWQMYLVGCTKDEAKTLGISDEMRGCFVRAGVSKQNYGAAAAEVWLRRTEGGVLVPAQFATSSVTMAGKGKAAKKIEIDDEENW